MEFPLLFQIFLNSPAFYDLFAYTELPTFDLASDAFATLRNDEHESFIQLDQNELIVLKNLRKCYLPFE